MGRLTPSEVRALRLAAQGETTRSAAARTGMSYETMKRHRANAIAKLAGRNMTHAVVLAIEARIIGVGGG